MDIPKTTDEITPEWLRVAIGESFPSATFSSLKHERIGEKFGFASRIYRYHWQDGGGPLSVVVKLWDPDGGAGVCEVRFYQSFSDIGIRIPACYFSGVDEENNAGILVLEDIQDAVQGDVLRPLNLEQATGVALSLAAMHARWLESPELEKHEWVADVSNWEPEAEWFKSRRSLFRERYENRLGGLASELLDKIEAAPKIVASRLVNAPRTLLHGDFHLDNILFEPEDQPVLLDWSRPVIGMATQNLAELLFKMIPLNQFDTILSIHLEAFNRVAPKPTNRQELESQLGGALLRQFSASTCGIARWQPKLPRAIRTIDKNLRKTSEVVEFWQARDPDLFSFLGRSQ